MFFLLRSYLERTYAFIYIIFKFSEKLLLNTNLFFTKGLISISSSILLSSIARRIYNAAYQVTGEKINSPMEFDSYVISKAIDICLQDPSLYLNERIILEKLRTRIRIYSMVVMRHILKIIFTIITFKNEYC